MTRTLIAHLPALARTLGPCLALLLALLAAWPDVARAGGFYRVAECMPGHTGTPDAVVEGSTTAYSASTSCESGNWLQVQSAAESQAGDAKEWVYEAPPGTQIRRATVGYNLVGDPSPDGNRSRLFIRRIGQAQPENLSVVGLGSTAGTYDSAIQDPGPLAEIGVGAFCSRATGTCGYAPGQFARLSTADFLMEDTVAPGKPVVVGPAADGDWVGGSAQLTVGETDVGSGVDRTTVAVDGEQVISDTICEPGRDGAGYVGNMAPCDALELRILDLDTTGPQFHEGPGNEIRVCTHEYGFAAASTCEVKSIRVDNLPPVPPRSLSVAGGTGWRRDNDFDLTWENPAEAHAPIAAATVEIEDGAGQVSTTTWTGPGIDSIDDLSVPAVGEYTARVYLRDAAGNESASAAAETVLRFDDTRPPTSQPQNSKRLVSHAAMLSDGFLAVMAETTRASDAPPSGIAGYRVAINSQPTFDPCGAPPDPRSCAGPPTEVGIDSNYRTLTGQDLREGSNWVHVVPISGSGMRAAEVGRTELKVDVTDPVSRLAGAETGWVNHPVSLAVDAEDALSGMVDTDEFPDDDPPRTVLSIDGREVEEFESHVEAEVQGSGVHHVEYWARDLAGNENDGAGGNADRNAAVIRIDADPPTLAFANGGDPGDPDRIEAPFSDGLSGVVTGRIAMRERGSTQWRQLPTILRADRLVARADSTEMTGGTVYEFRAEAADRAGNGVTTTRRQDGTDMVHAGPFRAPTRVSELEINGRSNARVRYGRRALATGRLLDRAGDPIAGADVELLESYASGSKRAMHSIATRTDHSGRFSARLPKGPSRSLRASFAGDARRLGATSGPVALRAKGAVTLRAPRRVRAGGRVRFRGRVKGRGADYSKRGKSLEVQVRIGRHWKTVGRSIHTDTRGRFRLRYRFVANYTRPVRYRFRAVVLRERGWPYLPARSRIRSLVVMP